MTKDNSYVGENSMDFFFKVERIAKWKLKNIANLLNKLSASDAAFVLDFLKFNAVLRSKFQGELEYTDILNQMDPQRAKCVQDIMVIEEVLMGPDYNMKP